MKEVDKYLLKNEKEKKLRRASLVLNNLKHEDKQRVSGILTYIVDNNDELAKEIKKLNKNIGVTDIGNDNGMGNTIIEEFNNDDDEAELKDDKLAELTEQLMTDLMKDFTSEENAEKTDKLNKGANTIVNLNKKDQEKILDTLENLAKDEKQKQIIEKLNKLVEYLNYMRFYLYSVNQNHLNKNKKQNKEINETQFKNIRNSVISSIFKEEDEENFTDFSMINDEQNISKAALRLSTLDTKNQNKILSEINEKVKSNNDINIIKSVDKLTATLKKFQISNIFSYLFNKKKPKKLGDSEIKEIAENINGVLEKDSQPTNFTEKLLVNKHKEQKINQLAKSIFHVDEESKRKTLSYLSQKLKINSQETINKFRDSIMNKKKADDSINIFASQFYIKSLGRTPLNEDELSLLIESFGKDLFDDSIKDDELKEDKLNLLANVIKELDDENQQKVLERLENMPKGKENPTLIEDFRYRIVKLNLLKDELNDEKNDKNLLDENQSIMLDLSTFRQPKKGDEIIENNEGDVDETVTVEITLDDIGQDEIKEICQVFNVDYEIDKKRRKKKKKVKKKK